MEKRAFVPPSPDALVQNAIRELSLDAKEFADSESFAALSPRVQMYALYGVVFNNWWENFLLDSKAEKHFLGPPKRLAKPFEFLHSPLNYASTKLQNHFGLWMGEQGLEPDEDQRSENTKHCIRLAAIRVDQLYRDTNPYGIAEDIFISRSKKGIGTAVEQCFKFALLAWTLLQEKAGNGPTGLEKDLFMQVVEDSQAILLWLASNHTHVLNLIEEKTEMGDSGSFMGFPTGEDNNLIGYKPEYFTVTPRGNSFILKAKTGEGKTLATIKRSGQQSFEEKPIKCPALHTGLIKPFSMAAAQHFWACLKTPAPSRHDHSDAWLANWMNQKGL